MSEGNVKTDILQDGSVDPAAAYRPIIDPINGVALGGMMRNLRMSAAGRLKYNTAAAINVSHLRNAARRIR